MFQYLLMSRCVFYACKTTRRARAGGRVVGPSDWLIAAYTRATLPLAHRLSFVCFALSLYHLPRRGRVSGHTVSTGCRRTVLRRVKSSPKMVTGARYTVC